MRLVSIYDNDRSHKLSRNKKFLLKVSFDKEEVTVDRRVLLGIAYPPKEMQSV